MTDFELLHSYASTGSEDAFATLVGRYANLVYSSALRQTRNREEAEEISQAVFTILARKAGTIRERTIFSGWLIRTTRLVALNAQRRQAHRRRTEQEAAANLQLAETDSAWKELAPLLDEALFSLGVKDRDAVVLRYFEQKSFREIAQILRTSEDNAQKRVSRAVARLRKILTKRGVVLPSAIVIAAITANSVQAAPAQLVAFALGAAASGSTLAGTASALVQATLTALKRAQAKTQAIKGAALALVLLLLFLGLYVLNTSRRSAPGPAAAGPTPAIAPQVAAIPAPAQANPGQLRLRVIDSQTGLPLQNARTTVMRTIKVRQVPSSQTNIMQTDIIGECLIPYGFNNQEDDWNLVIEIIKDAYVPRFVTWNQFRGDLVEDIPTEYTIKLDPGQSIGGVVLSKNGEPISGVTFGFAIPSVNLPRAIEGPAEREGLAIEHDEITDLQGRWLCNHIPRESEKIRLSLSHSNFIPASFDLSGVDGPPGSSSAERWQREVREQKGVITLKPGLAVAGMVVDEEGKPIAYAKLVRDRFWHQSEAIGLDGRFHIGNERDHNLVLTVLAEGYQPNDMTVRPGSTTNELRFELTRAAVLRGRVVDQDGKPIMNASVIAIGPDFESGRFDWGTYTDEQGRFEWRSAPPSQKVYTVQAIGYQSLSKLELLPDGTEHLITLQSGPESRRFRIFGNVFDVASKNPIDDFEVWLRSTVGPAQGGFGRSLGIAPQLRTNGKGGRFSFMTPFYSDNPNGITYGVEIKANGYLAETQDITAKLTNDYQINFDLKALPPLTGIVQTPNGQRARGAVVVVSSKKREQVSMIVPGQFDFQAFRGAHTETDANGVFSLPMTSSTGVVCVAHDSGYSRVPMEQVTASRTVRLEPWAAVTGSLLIGNKPGANVEIHVDAEFDEVMPVLQIHLTTTTDAEGHFVMNDIPAGNQRISHRVRASDSRAGGEPLTESVTVPVQSGQVSHVILGSAGRKLTGRIRERGPDHLVNWQNCSVGLTTQLPGSPVPNRELFATQEEYLLAMKEWRKRKSEYQKSTARLEIREYVTRVGADGGFAFSNVVPGAYELRIIADHPKGEVLLDPTKGPMKEYLHMLGLVDGVSREAIVPATTGTDAVPFDLGVWEINLKNPDAGTIFQ